MGHAAVTYGNLNDNNDNFEDQVSQKNALNRQYSLSASSNVVKFS